MVLNGLRQDRRNGGFGRHAQLGGQCCGDNAEDHVFLRSNQKLRAFHDALTGRRITIKVQLLHSSDHIKTRTEYPMNALTPEATLLPRLRAAPHFIVAVSPTGIARAALPILNFLADQRRQNTVGKNGIGTVRRRTEAEREMAEKQKAARRRPEVSMMAELPRFVGTSRFFLI